MIERRNDWVATLLNAEGHPEITEEVLYANGITPDNTGIKDKDYYKNIPQIQEKFTKDGKFDEDAYSQFYDSALRSYNSYSNDNFVNSLLDYYGTSKYDVSILSNPAQNVYKTGAVITNFYDRNRHSYGTGNIWEMGNANFSDREVAQANKVRDENGNILDWTPNDKGGLLKGLFRPTLVMASYDSDVYDDNGVLIHQKGELKLDENGDPYTEILGNRDSYGKDVVKIADTLTIEGTKLNDWDPFDSDGLNKSIGSTIAKTLFTMGPFFIPYVGPTLGIIAALGGIASALPTLSKAIDGFVTGNDDDAFGRSMTTIENAMSRFGFSQSDAAKGKFLSLENVSDIFSTSAGQLFSQRMIGKVPQLLAKLQQTGKINTKLGQQMSLGYMALTSANDTYGAFKEAGANDQVAGIGMLATIGGFWWLMNQAYFKDKLFEGSLLDEDQQLRRTFMDASRDINKDVYNSDLKQAVFKEGGFWDRLDKSKSKIPHALGVSVKKIKEVARTLPIGRAGGVENAFISRALNEGIEETMEEGMQDSIKALAKGLELIGVNVTDNPDDTLDFGMTPEEMLQRYASAFVGGALGGATFEVFNQVDLFRNPELKKFYQMAPIRRMVYDLQDSDNLDRYIRTIDKLYKNGKLGNKNLSATEYTMVQDPDNKNKGVRAYKQGTDNDNQNLAVRNLLLGVVHQVHDLLKENGLVKNSNLISLYALTNPKIQEEIKKSGLSVQEYWDKNRPDIIAGTLHDIGVLDTAVRQAKDIGEQIFNLQLKINAFENRSEKFLQLEGKPTELKEALKKDKDYQFLQDQLKVLQQKYNDIVDGKNGDDYMGFAYMLLADSPLKYYTDIFGSTTKNGESKSITTIENFAEVNFNIDYASLDKDSEIKAYIDEQFKDFMVGKEKAFWNIWQFHKNLEEKYADDITKANEFLKDHKIDPFHSSTTIGEYITDLTNERNQLLNKLEDIEKKPEDVDEEEVYSLQEDIIKKDVEIKTFQHLNPSLHLNELFDLDKFHQLIDPEVTTDNVLTFNSDELKEKAKQNVLSYYKYLKDNKIVSPTKEFLTDYLSKYLGKLGLEINNPMIENKVKGKWMKVPGDSEGFIKFVYGDTDVSTLSQDEFEEKINNARDEALGLFSSDKQINDLVSSLRDLLTLLQVNPAQGLVKYKELQKKLDSEINFDAFNALIQDDIKYDSKTLLNEMLFTKHSDTIDFVSNIMDIIDSLDVSPTFDILKDLSVKMTGGYNKILDLLQQQRQNLGSGIENFQLNETMKKALDEAQMLLNIYAALIDSAQSNLNGKVNEYRRPLGKKPFAEISEETKNIILKDINYLQSQIDYLKVLGGANLEKRFIEQQQIMKNDTVKRVKFFVEPPKEYKLLVEDLEKILGVKFADIWKGDFDIDSDEKFAAFDKNRIEFESEIYKHFNSDNSEAQKINIIQSIADQFKADKTFLTSNAGLLTSDDSTVTAYGMYRYLLLNLATDSKQVASWYKTVMKDSPFVPFYSQELIIRDALANYLNRDLYNAGLKVLEQLKNENSEFIKECLVLKNFLFINGVPGAGKTAVIANTIKKIIRLIDGNDDTQFISLSMTKTQADKLANSIEEPNTGHTWAEFKQVNTTEAGEEYDGSEGHKLIKGFKSKLNLSEISKNPKAKKYVIFFDEIQLLKEPDVIKLNQIVDDANNNGYQVMVFGLGDLMQTSVFEKGNEISITNTLFNSSFRLSASFRETNQGKSENTLAVASKLQVVMENLYNKKDYNISEANNATNDVFGNKTELRWYDDGRTIYGDKFIKHSDIDATLDKLKSYVRQHDSKSKEPEIAIVVETEDDKQEYALKINNDPRIGVYTKTEISGGEFDYVIIDSKLNQSPFMAAKEFYTLMSRARNASFFVAEKTQTLNLYSNDQGTPSAANLLSAKDSENQKKIYDSFKEWRMKLFDGIPEVSAPEKPKETEGVSTTGGTASTFGSESETVIQKYNKADLPSEQEINDYIDFAENDDTEQSKDNHDALEARKKRSLSEEKGTIKNRQSKTENDCDGEIFEEWLKTNDPSKLGWSIVPNIDSEADIEQYRDFLRHFSSFILTLASKEKDARDTQIQNINDIVRTGSGNIGDRLSKALDYIKSALKTNTGYYYVTILDDKHSLIYYVFNVDDKQYAIPVTIVNGNISGVKYTTLKSEKVADYAFISSKGKYHLDPRDVAKGKVSVGSHYATVINKKGRDLAGGLYHQEGKSFALFGEFNKAIEESADVEAKDFLVFELEDGKIVSYYQRDKEKNKDTDIEFKIRGIQRQLPINDFVQLCQEIQKEHSSNTTSLEEVKALDDSIAKTLGIKKYQRNLNFAKKLGENKDDLTSRIRLMTGEARRKFIDAIHKTIGEYPIYDNGISKFWFANEYNREKGWKPIIQIIYYTDNDKSNGIPIYLKKIGDTLVLCDRNGKYFRGENVNDDNSFTIPSEKGTWAEFIQHLVASVKKLDKNDTLYSVIPTTLSNEEIYSKISVDYYIEGEKDGESFVYPRYIEDIVNIFDSNQWKELQYHLEQDPEFIHGVYLNLQVETFLNVEDGEPSAEWGVNEYKGSGIITSDDVYIFAPIYNLTSLLTEKGENISISTLDTPNRQKTKDLIIEDPNYTKKGDEWEFNKSKVRVSKNWLFNSVTEKSKQNIPTEGEMFSVYSINPVDKTIKIWIDSDRISKPLIFKNDFNFDILNDFTNNQRTIAPAWDNNYNLIIENNKIYAENRNSKEKINVELIGENNSGFYYLVNDEYKFYKYDDDPADAMLKGLFDSNPLINRTNRGFILGIFEQIPIFIAISKTGYEFRALQNNDLVSASYDPSTGIISIEKIEINANEIENFESNLKDFQNNDTRNIQKFKDDLVSKFKEYNLFEEDDIKYIVESNTIEDAIKAANEVLQTKRYLFEDGNNRTVENDNGKLKIVEKKDKAVILGNILLKRVDELNNNPESILSIEKINSQNTSDFDNYLVTLQIDGKQEQRQYTLFKNDMGQWDAKIYTEIERDLDDILSEVEDIVSEEEIGFIKEYFNNRQQGQTSEELEEQYDNIYSKLPEKTQINLDAIFEKLNRCP